MADNTYVNKVIVDGSSLIDLTSDTAVAADVASGKYFHLRTGEQVQGTNTYDADTSDANAAASEILATKTAYVAGNKITGSMTNRGAVTGEIETISSGGAYTIPQGYHDGSGTVDIKSTEKEKIIATNIKSGIEILGVVGTYAGETVTAAAVNITPTFSSQTVTPPTGYDYISQANVAAIPYAEADNEQGGKTVTIG